jgi:hypothetical protein
LESECFLGAGGHADVFLYQDRDLGRPVAVKILRGVDDEEAKKRFADEFDVQSRLSDHQNVARVIRKDTVQDRPYSVMDFYRGLSLATKVKKPTLPVERILRVGVKIAGALETAHRRQIIHRDIKPANILLDATGEPFLTDFGIAATQVGVVSNEQNWMSLEWTAPEVVAGQQADARGDVYSLAATLYHLLAGRSPFRVPGGNNSEDDLRHRILAGSPPPTGRNDIPASLEALMSRAMAVDPADRPATAILLAEGLQALQKNLGHPVTEVSVQPAHPARPRPVQSPATLPPPATGPRARAAPAAAIGPGDQVSQPPDSTLRRGTPRALPDPAAIHTRAQLADGLARLAEATGRSYSDIADRAGRHPGGGLGPATRIRRRLNRASRNRALPGRDFVTGYVRGCHCDTAGTTCTCECSASQLGPWLLAWDRAAADPAPVARKRVRRLIALGIVAVAIGAGIGIYLAVPHGPSDPGQPAPDSTTALYRVQASLVYRPDKETATIRWNSDITKDQGFTGFLVIKWVDGRPETVGGTLPKDQTSLAVPDVPKNRAVCFEVIAYGVNRTQAEPPPKPCNTDGAPTAQQPAR